MEQKSHRSPSFINIAVLLLFAVVIAVASSLATYLVLSSKINERYSTIQTPVTSQHQTTPLHAIGFTYYIDDEDCMISFMHPDYLTQEPGQLRVSNFDANLYPPTENIIISCQKDVVQKIQQEIQERIQKPAVINYTTYTSNKPVVDISSPAGKYTRYYDKSTNLDVGIFYNPYNKKWIVVQSSQNLSTLVFQTIAFIK